MTQPTASCACSLEALYADTKRSGKSRGWSIAACTSAYEEEEAENAAACFLWESLLTKAVLDLPCLGTWRGGRVVPSLHAVLCLACNATAASGPSHLPLPLPLPLPRPCPCPCACPPSLWPSQQSQHCPLPHATQHCFIASLDQEQLTDSQQKLQWGGREWHGARGQSGLPGSRLDQVPA